MSKTKTNERVSRSAVRLIGGRASGWAGLLFGVVEISETVQDFTTFARRKVDASQSRRDRFARCTRAVSLKVVPYSCLVM